MRDIKLTLSTDPAKRSPSTEEEARWLAKQGELWYPLGPNRPVEAGPGCWVYFIRGGKLVSRAKAESFDPPSGKAKVSYTGSPTNRGSSWEVRVTAMELARVRLDHPGFRGFRYVTPDEQASFERAFE